MATPSAPTLVYAELAPHSIHIAVLAGRKIVAVRAFALDAKADIAAFVVEQQITGVTRATLVGSRNFIHRSAEAESGAIRQPAALQGHAARLPHGFESTPVCVVVDAATGAAPDAARVTPWVLSAVDGASFAAARATLDSLGLAAADLTLAAPAHLGVVAGSLAAGETALVLLPGDDDAQLAWVTTEGVQAVATAPVGYVKIYEAVQQGLGLKFKAAAGKLLYNEGYDFADAAPKIAEPLAAALKPVLAGRGATHLHFVGLTASQAWLLDALCKALNVRAWAPGAALNARLGLDAGSLAVSSASAGLFKLASAGATDAAWMQSTLETLAARARTTAAPFPFAQNGAAGGASSGKTTLKMPAKSDVPQTGGKPANSPVVSVGVAENAPRTEVAPAHKGKKGPALIGAGLTVVALVVGVAWHFRSPKDSSDRRDTTPPPAATPALEPAKPTPPVVAKPEATPAPAPTPKPAVVTPPPAVVSTAPAVATGPSADLAASEARKFSNDRYRFEVTEKGFIQGLSTARDEVLIESAGGISLQGSYVATDGRKKFFNVGGVDDLGYQATVKKSVTGGVTQFDVKVTHPRFELEQTFVCQPNSVKVSSKFSPINMRDPRGVIAAVHSVRLSPTALNPSLRMKAADDAFAFSMKAGALNVSFDSGVWARDGADGKQNITATENAVAFHFTDSTEAARNQLNYVITLP